MNPAFILAIAFVCFVAAFFVWLQRDKNSWTDLSERLKGYYAKTMEYQEEAKAAKDSADALRQTVLSYKMQIDSYKQENDFLRDHLQKMQQSVLLSEHKIKTLSDQVHGFSIRMPESISITLTKDVKSATTGRDHKAKGDSSIKNGKVRRAKVEAKTARRS